jgi:hypothetical protein
MGEPARVAPHETPARLFALADVVPNMDLSIAVSPDFAITSATTTPTYTPNGPASRTGTPYSVFSPAAFVQRGVIAPVGDTPLAGGLPTPGQHGGVRLNGLENVFRPFLFDATQWQRRWAPSGSVPACDPLGFLPGRPAGLTFTTPPPGMQVSGNNYPATSCVGELYDNQVRYDAARGRFWITSAARNIVWPSTCTNASSPDCRGLRGLMRRVNLVAVSKTADPHEGFFTYVSSDDWHQQGDEPWFMAHNDLAIAYATGADHPLRVYDADALAGGTALQVDAQPLAQLTKVYAQGGIPRALEGDSRGTVRVAKHRGAVSAMTYVVVGSGSRIEVFGAQSNGTARTPPTHVSLYGPATFQDPTGFVWGGALTDAVYDGDGGGLYVFSGQASNVSPESSTRVVKLAVSPAQVRRLAELAPGAADFSLVPPAGMTIDYTAADLTSNGDVVVGFRAVPPPCTPATGCTSNCAQAGPRLAMIEILYRGEFAFRPAQALRTPARTCGGSRQGARIDYVFAQADPPNGVLGGRGVWLSLGDEEGRLVATVVP